MEESEFRGKPKKAWKWRIPFSGAGLDVHGVCKCTDRTVRRKPFRRRDVTQITEDTAPPALLSRPCWTPSPQVNGVLKSLPVYLADGRISVVHGGTKAVLETDFGLQVTYDWNARVEVTLPSSYYDAVCGLCGNMDKNSSNDQVFPNGTMAPSIPTWGGSWQVPGWDPLCWNECQGSCATCPEDRVEMYEGPGFCGPLAPGAGGPFASCHSHVPPESFFRGCVLDLCLGGQVKDILCQALATYAEACQAAGIKIQDWRTQAGCGEWWGPGHGLGA